MKTWSKLAVFLLTTSFGLALGRAEANQTVDGAIQAIQQAPDPSAAVSAFANGFARDRNDPKLYDAYVARMVELGLPEMAYHQAQTLTTLQSNNGLAWGVVAYVDARRAQMPEAISALNLAGQFAPDNQFIQHTAGEIIAWYDLKADKATIPDNAKNGLSKVRTLLVQRPAYTEAYSTAQKAYQAQASTSTQPAAPAASAQAAPTQVAPEAAAPTPTVSNAPQAQVGQVAPLGYATVAPAYYQPYSTSYYYPDYAGASLGWGPSYCYGWGTGWVAPTPWCWWQPWGFWGGASFYPCGFTVVFGGCHPSHCNGAYAHNGHSGHGGAPGHGQDPAFWHHNPSGGKGFYGTPARPSAAVAQWARAGSQTRAAASVGSAVSSGTGWLRGTGRQSAVAVSGSSTRLAQPNTIAARPNSAVVTRPGPAGFGGYTARSGGVATPRGNWNGTPALASRSVTVARSPVSALPAVRSSPASASSSRVAPVAPATRGAWAGQNYSARSFAAPRNTLAVPSYRAPVSSAPRYMAPSASSFGGSVSGRSGAALSAAPRSFGGSVGGVSRGAALGGGVRSGSFSGGGARAGGGGGHR